MNKKHTNVWKKTCIQMYEENMHTNTHTNVWKKHAYKCMTKTHTNMHTKKTGIQMYEKNILIMDSQLQRPGSKGCLAQGHLSHDKKVNCNTSSCLPANPFCWAVSGDWTANPLVVRRPHSPLCHGQPKYKCKNVWQKHAYKIAYKCMTKTRIQMYEKNMHTNTHTNGWKKPAYKCMKKTCE